MRVATYCRISTDEERQPFSLEAQTDRLASYVASQPGWNIVRSFADQMSGKTLDRPALQQALADARQGRFDLLLVFKVDRLARSTLGLARILEDLEAAGVVFRSSSEPFDTGTAAGRMMVQMLGVFGEFEREMIVERTRMGLAKKASKGEWTGGTPPFGYRYDSDRRVLEPTDEESALVHRVFTLYADRRWGSAAIARWLNDTCRTTRRGARWTPKTVLDVLRNPTYVGALPFRGEVHPGSHELIVDPELFDRVQAILKERGQNYPLRSSNSTAYVLTSLMRCGRCGHGFVGTAAHGRGGTTYRYYSCFSRQRHGTARCDQERIPADALEQAVLQEALAALDDGSIFEEAARRALEEWHEAHPETERELHRIEKRIEQRRKAIDRYLRAFEAARLSEETCGYRIREIEKELVTLEAEAGALESESDLAPSSPSAALLSDLRARVAEAVAASAPEQIKELLAAVVSRIVVESRASIQPYFVAPAVRTLLPSRRRTGIEPACELVARTPVLKFGDSRVAGCDLVVCGALQSGSARTFMPSGVVT